MDVTYFIATYFGAKVQRASAQQRARYGKRFAIGLCPPLSQLSGSKIGVELMDPNKLVDSPHTDDKT